MRVAVYVRVSTLRQAQTQTIEEQLERLRAHIETQGWALPEDHVFRDDGYSGATLNRPGLDRLRDQVRAAELDRVLLTAPDRLARNYVHQMVLLEEMERFGCEVEFLDHPMGRDPHDQLLLQIRGAVAEYERTLMARRACVEGARGSCARVGCCPGRGCPMATAPILTGPETRPGCAWSPLRQRSSPSSLPVILKRM